MRKMSSYKPAYDCHTCHEPMPIPSYFPKRSTLNNPSVGSGSQNNEGGNIEGIMLDVNFREFLEVAGLHLSPCNHVAHKECAQRWIKSGGTGCAVCRGKDLSGKALAVWSPDQEVSTLPGHLGNRSPSMSSASGVDLTSRFSYNRERGWNILMAYLLSLTKYHVLAFIGEGIALAVLGALYHPSHKNSSALGIYICSTLLLLEIFFSFIHTIRPKSLSSRQRLFRPR